MSDAIIILNLIDDLSEDWKSKLTSVGANIIGAEDSNEQKINYILCSANYDLEELNKYKVLEDHIKLIVLGKLESREDFLKYNGCLNVEDEWIKKGYATQIIRSILLQEGSIHISEMFSDKVGETQSIKIESRSDIGYYVDQIGNAAFKEDFDLVKVRTFAMFALSYLSYTEDSSITNFPFEVEMAKVGDDYCVQIICNSSSIYTEYLEQSFMNQGESPLKVLIHEMMRYSDFLNIQFVSDGNKFLLSALWEKDAVSLNTEYLSINNIKSFRYTDTGSENIADEFTLNKSTDKDNANKDLPEKIKSPTKEEEVFGGSTTGSFMDSLDDDYSQTVSGDESEKEDATVVSGSEDDEDGQTTVSGSEEDEEGATTVSGSEEDEEGATTVSGSTEDEFSEKLVSDNVEDPEHDSTIFDSDNDIEREIEGWNKAKVEAISEHKEDIEAADGQDEIDEIVKNAIFEKISIPPEELDELVKNIKDALEKGEVFRPKATSDDTDSSNEIERLVGEINKRNGIITNLKKIIDNLKAEVISGIQLEKFENNEVKEEDDQDIILQKYRSQLKALHKDLAKREAELEKLKMQEAEGEIKGSKESDEMDVSGGGKEHDTEEVIQLRERVKQLEGVHEVDITRAKNMNDNIEKYKKQLHVVDEFKKKASRKDAEINSLTLEVRDLKAKALGSGEAADVEEQSAPKANTENKTIQRLASQLNEAQIDLKEKTKKAKELEQKNKFLNGQLLTAAGGKDKGAGAKANQGKEKEQALKIKKQNARITQVEELARRFKTGFEAKKLELVKMATENRKLKREIAQLNSKDKKSA